MEKLRFRCHFSIIFESLWQFWIVIFFILINEIEFLIEVIREVGKEGIYSILQTSGIWGVLIVLAFTFVVLLVQFLIWRKTWITVEDNLVIVERNTLKRVKNTIAIENISAVNMERNLFERVVGTYRIKIDTNSMTTANETDISIVFSEKMAIGFRKLILERMNTLKGNAETPALSEERQPDQLFEKQMEGKKFFHVGFNDMIKHALYTMPLFSLIISVAGIGVALWFIMNYGFMAFIEEAIGGLLAVVFVVVAAIFNVLKRFVKYYDFTVYRDGKDLHVRCGLIKLRSYTIPIDKISALQIEQPFFSRFFKKYSVKVVTVGVGDEEGESSNITMSLSKEQLREHLTELVPEFGWAEFDQIEKEEKAGAKVRLVKSIKWHIITVIAVLIMMLYYELPWFIGILIPLACDAWINLLYVLSHKTAGYSILDQGLILATGYFNKVYMMFTYKKAQYISMTYHPIAKKYGVGDGMITLLNSAASVPYIKEELAHEIEDRIIG
ncbi:MAG: PH domain-containing protein [Firmicutes bacterium]|nr:PH domain-containing protein [Bacillota bacterium]